MSSSPERALFIRLDKIGDVILTLPVDAGLKESKVEVTWLLNPRVRFLIEQGATERQAEYLDSTFSLKEAVKLYRFVKKIKPNVAVFFWSPWWVAFVIWLACVPLRVGRFSQWYSFIFFNRGLRQKRSRSEKHESQYSKDLRDLIWPTAGLAPSFKFRKLLRRALFERWHLQPRSYIIVHPGMAGSALNWPHFSELISQLIAKNETIVITGSASDKFWTEPLRGRYEKHRQVRWTVNALEIEDLLFLLQNAKSVVAPSTGVAHLAASCETRLIGLYSPIPSQHPRRWGPLGERVSILIPEVNCPTQIECWGEKCQYHPCMAKISVERVLHELAETT